MASDIAGADRLAEPRRDVVGHELDPDRLTVEYWLAQGCEFREMDPWEPVPPPNVVAHWVENGVAYWVVENSGPVPLMAHVASREIFHRRYRVAGVAPGRAAVAAAHAWRKAERAARQLQAGRSRALEAIQDRTQVKRPEARLQVTASARHRVTATPDQIATRRAAEAQEAKARAARRAGGRVKSPSKMQQEERNRGQHQHI